MGNVSYYDPFMFLNNTPTVNNLVINPVPDIIIKTWYDGIIKGVQKAFPENEFSKQKLETEFNQAYKQLEYEWDNFTKKPVEIEKPSYSRIKSVMELITKGENRTLEFKETFQYNIETKQTDNGIRHDALKTIAGFLNADGGTLIIGISDNGEVKGIARDKKAMNRASDDKFELAIRNHIAGNNSKFEPSAIGYVKFTFEKMQGHKICIIDIQPLPKTEILHFDGIVYVRDGNRTLKLQGLDLTNWIQQRAKSRMSQVEKAREHDQQVEKRRARITAKLEHLQRHGCYELNIKNNGVTEACDVKAILSGKPISELKSISPQIPSFSTIGPDSNASYHWQCKEPVRPPFELEITWSDDSGKPGLYRTTLSHPTTPKTS